MGMRIGDGASALPSRMPAVPGGIVLKLSSEEYGFVSPFTNDDQVAFGPLMAGNRDVFDAKSEDPDHVVSAYRYESAYCFKKGTGELLQTSYFGRHDIHRPISIIDHQPYMKIFGKMAKTLRPRNAEQQWTLDDMFALMGYDEMIRRDAIVPEIIRGLTKGTDPKVYHITTLSGFDAAYSLDWSRQFGPDTALFIRSMNSHLFYYRHPDRSMRVYCWQEGIHSEVFMRDHFILGEEFEAAKALYGIEPQNERQYQTQLGFLELVERQIKAGPSR